MDRRFRNTLGAAAKFQMIARASARSERTYYIRPIAIIDPFSTTSDRILAHFSIRGSEIDRVARLTLLRLTK